MTLKYITFFLVIGVYGASVDTKTFSVRKDGLMEQNKQYISTGRNKRQIVEFSDMESLHSCKREDGSNGVCRPYTRRCLPVTAMNNIFATLSYLCTIRDRVGVCCSENADSIPAEKLAGELPAFASTDEDIEDVLRVQREENRGCGIGTKSLSKISDSEGSDQEWPWVASIGKKDEEFQHEYGGALITDQHVLTVAHGAKALRTDELAVRLGEYDFERVNDSRSLTYDVIEIRVHPDFTDYNHHNDIAILKLSRSTIFNTYIWPLCLPPPDLDLLNQTTVLAGWGTTTMTGPLSDILLEAPLPVWDLKKCRNSLVDRVFDENLCAATYEGGVDACQHDSGSPLMYRLPSGRWSIVGMVSWGIGCGERGLPTVYVRVDKYLSWIHENSKF